MFEDDGVDKPLAYSSAVLFRKTVREDLERVSDGSNPIVAGFDRTGYIINTLSKLRGLASRSLSSGKAELEVPVLDVMIEQYKRYGYFIQARPCRDAVLHWLEMEERAGSAGVMPFTMGFFDMCAGRDREPDEPQGYEDPYKLEDWIKRAEPYFSDLVERYALAVNAMVHEPANKYYN